MAERNLDEYATVRRSSKPSPRCHCDVCVVLRLSARQLQFVTERHALALSEEPRFGGNAGSRARVIRPRKNASDSSRPLAGEREGLRDAS